MADLAKIADELSTLTVMEAAELSKLGKATDDHFNIHVWRMMTKVHQRHTTLTRFFRG